MGYIGCEFFFSPSSSDSSYKKRSLTELKQKLDSASHIEEKTDIFFDYWLEHRGSYVQENACILDSLLQEAKDDGSNYSIGWCYFMLGWHNLDHHEQESGLALFDDALKNFKECDNWQAQIRTLNGKASAYRQLGRFDKAIEIYNKALDEAQKCENNDLINIIAGNIANILIDLRQYDDAIEYFLLAESVKASFPKEQAVVNSNFGKAYRCLGDFKKAEEKLLESLQLCKGAHSKYAKVYCILELGFLKQAMGEIEAGEAYFRQCLAIANTRDFPRIKAIALLQLGIMEKDANNFDQAMEYLMESLRIFKKINASNHEARTLLALADLYEEKGDYANAFVALKTGQNLEKEAFNEETINRIGVLKVQQAHREDLLYKELYNRIATISQIGQAITSTFDIKKIGSIIYRHIKLLMAADSLAIGLLSEDKKEIIYRIRIKNGNFLPEFAVKTYLGFAEDFKGITTVTDSLASNDSDLMDRINRLQILQSDKINSFIISPLIFRERILGLVTVQSEGKNAYSNHHVDIVKAFVAYTAIAVENEKLYSHLKDLASTDYLTQLPNRRSVFQRAFDEFTRYKRYKQPFSVIMMDIDNFKQVNDKFGHGTGDMVLKKIAQIFLKNLRQVDTIGRIGGEEFLLLLPNSDSSEAKLMAERIRAEISKNDFGMPAGEKIRITVSMGVAEVSGKDKDIYRIINRADQALYEAKASGGNSVM